MKLEHGRKIDATYSMCWEDRKGRTNSVQVQGLELSRSGMLVRSSAAVLPGSLVYIEGQFGDLSGHALVRECSAKDQNFVIAFEFTEDTKKNFAAAVDQDIDYYEYLQISPRAEPETIHRVYRFMASRFHPDNPETGDREKFLLLTLAFETLSDPERRAEYDRSREARASEPNPIFELKEFVDGISGEVNRRLGVLSVLYNKRRTDPQDPHVSLLDLEKWMNFPREHLDFTTWYLKCKQYIKVEDNSDFTLTVLGVDYVEANAQTNPVLTRLLKSGSRTATDSGATEDSAAGKFDLGPLAGELDVPRLNTTAKTN